MEIVIPDILPTGTKLLQYEIKGVLGQGGFGITYLAWDIKLDSLVAIKEFLPHDFAARKAENAVHPRSEKYNNIFKLGLERFLLEARTLAKFKNPNIVRVLNFFEANGTAYFVMEYEKGENLDTLLKKKKILAEKEILEILTQILQGLKEIHDKGIVHRDIKPSNIFIREDGSPVLIDFGSARHAFGRHTKNITILVTPPYAPYEQYETSTDRLGAWTDLYSLGAVAYRAITNAKLVESTKRIGAVMRGEPDPLPPAVETAKGQYSLHFLKAIDNVLRILEEDRPQSADEWLKQLKGQDPEMFKEPRPTKFESIQIDRKAYAYDEESATEPITIWNADLYKAVKAAKEKSQPVDKKKFGFGIAKIYGAIGVILLILLAGSGWFFFSGKFQPKSIIKVETNPSHANVYIDGKHIGISPCQKELTLGDHKIRISKDRYEDYKESFMIQEGEPVLVQANLTAKPFEELEVASSPAGAEILIDGIEKGTTPTTLENLPTGTQKMILKKHAFDVWEEDIQITAGDVTKINADLKPKYGSLAINSIPTDAKCYLDGKYMGSTPYETANVQKGEHIVKIEKKNYDDWKKKIEVIAGETRRVIAILGQGNGQSKKISNSYGMEFIPIVPGTFTMGSPSDEPGRGIWDEDQYEVELSKEFYMQTTEVTQGQWKAVMGNNPSYFKNCGDDCPVENVSFEDVEEFIQKLNHMEGGKMYQLPTEAQWEYACRAGSTTVFSNGVISKTGYEIDSNLNAIGWFLGNSKVSYTGCIDSKEEGRPSCAGPHQVAQKQPNGWGLYDMHGNVWEWCQDWYERDYPTKRAKDPKGPSRGTLRVFRGGAWNVIAKQCRSANRGSYNPIKKSYSVGFRLVKNKEP